MIVSIAIACSSCNEGGLNKFFPPKKTAAAVSAIIDVSDTGLVKSEESILNVIPFRDDNLEAGLVYRDRYVSASESHEVDQLEIDPVNYWMTDRAQRVAQLKKLRSQITAKIGQYDDEAKRSESHSMVNAALAKEANALSGINAEERVVIYLGDLLNSTDEFSFYKKQAFEMAQRQPEVVAAKFQEVWPIAKAQNMTAYLIYQPATHEEQSKYDVALKVVTLWLEGQGIKVIAGPNILPAKKVNI